MHWEIDTTKPSCLRELPEFPTGLLYGYSVYTTFKLPLAEVWLQAHLERLESNAKAIGLAWLFNQTEILETIYQLYQPEAPVYRLSLIPRVSHYGDLYSQSNIPSGLLFSLRPTPSKFRNIALKTVAYSRPVASIKISGMGELIFFRRHAQATGFDDILLVAADGFISEASTANLFFIQKQTLCTPNPTEHACLPGITRMRVLKAASEFNIPIRESSIRAHEIPTLEGAFLTNAAQNIIPIARIDTFNLPWPASATAMMNQLETALHMEEKATSLPFLHEKP
jgi:branched-subunit amino acid aminotransferase/4-amino-4-deoxychorismate lyase